MQIWARRVGLSRPFGLSLQVQSRGIRAGILGVPLVSLDRLHSNSPTIRARILALVGFVLVPTLAAFTWLAVSYAGAQRHLIEVERTDLAKRITALLDREIAEIKGTLTTLAASPDISDNDLTEFRRHSALVSKQPGFRAIELFDASGRRILSTAKELEPLPTLQARDDVIATALKKPMVVSDVTESSGDDRSSFAIAVPVTPRGGEVQRVLAAIITPDHLSRLFLEAGINPEWTAAIVDWNGRFVARSRGNVRYLGRMARPELGRVAKEASMAGEFENVTHEGVASLNSYRRSTVTGWTVVAAVPRELLTAPLWRTMTWVILGGAVASLLSVLLASVMASRISEPVRGLSKAAAALVDGKAIPDIEHRIAELDEVHAAFELAAVRSSHLAAIVASSGDAIMSVGLDGRIRSWNSGAEKLFGHSEREMIGQPLSQLIPEERRSEAERHFEQVMNGETLRVETTRQRKDGSEVHVSLNLAPIRSPGGAIIGKSTIAHDITERKAAEAHQRFLMRELTHRSKNLLAIVQSMASQTARSAENLDRFLDRFTSRLHGLASSHDLLVKQNWSGAPLEELVRSQLAVFLEGRKSLTVEGPPVVVDTKAAQTIGLALHELATNSLKYGALSSVNGRLAVRWELLEGSANGKGPSLALSWIERGGPEVAPPERTGFGRFVIDRMVRQAIDGEVQIEFAPLGLEWRLTIPPEFIVRGQGRPAIEASAASGPA